MNILSCNSQLFLIVKPSAALNEEMDLSVRGEIFFFFNVACSIVFLSELPAVVIELSASGCCLSSVERLRRRAQNVDCLCDYYVSFGFFLLFRFASDLTEQSGSAAPGWRTGNTPGSELSQGHVQCGIAQWQDIISDPSRKNPQSGAACWPEIPLQVCHPLVGDLEPQTYRTEVFAC